MKSLHEKCLPSLSVMSVAEEDHIPLVERLWSYITRNNLWKLNRKEKDSRYIIIEIDGIALISEDLELGLHVVHSPNDAQQKLTKFLKEIEVFRQRSDRLWIRLVTVPYPFTTVSQLRSVPLHCDEATPIHFYGIVNCVSGVNSQIYSRRLRCVYCNKEQWIIEDFHRKDPVCCSDQLLEEHQASRVMIPSQNLEISIISFADCVEPEIEMKVSEELAGAAKLGDLVEVIGLVHYQPSSRKRSNLLAEAIISCNNIRQLVSPWELAPPTRPSPALNDCSLEFICRLFQDSVRNLHPPSFLIGSLLSVVMISGERLHAQRDQIHILLTSYGHDPYTETMLEYTSSVLSPLNHYMKFHDKIPQLCEVHKIQQTNGKNAEVTGKYIVSSKTGISVLDLTQLTKNEKSNLVEYLSRSVYSPHAGPEFGVSVTSTAWSVLDTSLKTHQQQSLGDYLGEELCDLFDIVVPFSVQNDNLYDEMSIRRLFSQESFLKTANQTALWSLLSRGGTMKPPRMSREAKHLLQQYYTFSRKVQEGRSRPVPIQVSSSLLRLAAASARLTFSPSIRPVPDATLAIKLTEETLLETGVYTQPSRLILDLDDVSMNGQFSSLDAELAAMHKVIRATLFPKALQTEE